MFDDPTNFDNALCQGPNSRLRSLESKRPETAGNERPSPLSRRCNSRFDSLTTGHRNRAFTTRCGPRRPSDPFLKSLNFETNDCRRPPGRQVRREVSALQGPGLLGRCLRVLLIAELGYFMGTQNLVLDVKRRKTNVPLRIRRTPLRDILRFDSTRRLFFCCVTSSATAGPAF